MKSPVACLAEVGSIQIEFTRLSELTGDWQYHYVVCFFFFSYYFKIRTKKKIIKGQRVYDSYIKMNSMKGLYPHLINVNTGLPVGGIQHHLK